MNKREFTNQIIVVFQNDETNKLEQVKKLEADYNITKYGIWDYGKIMVSFSGSNSIDQNDEAAKQDQALQNLVSLIEKNKEKYSIWRVELERAERISGRS